jgi:hypothetical protein
MRQWRVGARLFFRRPQALLSRQAIAMKGPSMAKCPRTGITLPECSCAYCLEELVRRHQPALVAADPTGEIRVTRSAPEPAPTRRRRWRRRSARRAA